MNSEGAVIASDRIDLTGGDAKEFVNGASPAMRVLESVIAEIAQTNVPILLLGESGTGKEIFARRIHALSAQKNGRLNKIQCASMSPALLLSELGLAENGARRRGRAVETGSLFLDEVSELDLACQRQLLNALPENESAGLGNISSRLISASSRNLDDDIRSGRFRPELFYRINGMCLRLVPLRERKEDIPLLVDCFLKKHAAQSGRVLSELSARTLEIFSEYRWPGNIRQLENIVKNIVILGNEEFAVSELLASAPQQKLPAPAPVGDSLRAASRAASREAERELILKALDRTRWNRKRAAQELRISYKSLLHKLKQIGAEEPEIRAIR